MRVISIVTLLAFCHSVFGQKGIEAINGFKYAFVDVLQYDNNQVDIYGLTSFLRESLSRKGLKVLDYDPSSWPNEVKSNPCLVGRWIPAHSAGNRAGFTVKNCKDEIVYQNSASSVNWMNDFYDNFQRAVRRSFEQVESFRYSFNPGLTPELELPEVESVSETEESLRQYFDSNKIDPLEGIYKSYQDELTGYYKIGIKRRGSSYVATIIEADLKHWKKGEIKAYLEPTTLRSIFSTTWLMSNKAKVETFAVLEDEGILSFQFEAPDKEGKRSSKFIKLYPLSSTSNSSHTKPSLAGVSGSGFVVAPNGIIATNAHVVTRGEKFEASFSDSLGNFTYKAKLLLKDESNDIALLKIEDTGFTGFNAIPYAIDETTEVGERVFTIGYPISSVMGDNYKVTDGIISANSGIGDDVRFMQISVPLQPGNSGGPLFNKSGNVVGLATAKLNSEAVGVSIENVNYAIKASYLLNLLKMLPEGIALPKESMLTDRELKDQVKRLKSFVCLIRVY
jgi:S1-C subfamily serine protease